MLKLFRDIVYILRTFTNTSSNIKWKRIELRIDNNIYNGYYFRGSILLYLSFLSCWNFMDWKEKRNSFKFDWVGAMLFEGLCITNEFFFRFGIRWNKVFCRCFLVILLIIYGRVLSDLSKGNRICNGNVIFLFRRSYWKFLKWNVVCII